MMAPAIRFLAASSMVAGVVLLVTSCSVLKTEQVVPAKGAQSRPAWKITQLNFGRDASFAVCIEPACPVVTRKTLTIQPQAPARATAPSVDITATLDPGEEEWKGQPNPRGSRFSVAEHPRSPVVVTFAPGSAALSNAARATLEHAASGVQATNHILIVGRTDNIGNKRANDALALARARAVRDYLRVRLPAHPRRVFTLDAQGACCFTASNKSPEGRRQNRRVEVVFRISRQVAP